MSRRYRSQGFVTGGMLVGLTIFLVLGVTMLLASPAGDAPDRVLGGMFTVFAAVGGGDSLSSVVVLSPEGIAYRSSYRRRFISWDAVESFTVVPASGMGPWFNVGVELRPMGAVRVAAIRGSRSYIERVVAEFDAFRAELGARVQSPTSNRST